MRFSTAFKVLGLVALGVLTSWATRAIVAQTKSARTAVASRLAAAPQAGAAAARPPMVSTAVQSVRESGPNLPAANVRTPQEVFDQFVRSTMLAETTLLGMEATGAARQVIVSESVHIMEKSKASYVWALRVYRGPSDQPGQPPKKLSERLLSERYYFNQVFQVPGDEMQMTTSFREAFELEPGVYFVEVGLHRIRPNFDLQGLNNESVKQFKSRVSDIKRVVVTD
jgi:hypothetical protein